MPRGLTTRRNLLQTHGLLVEQVAQGTADTHDGVERLRLEPAQVHQVQDPIVVHQVEDTEIAHMVPVQRELHLGEVRDNEPPRHMHQFLGVDAGTGTDFQHVHIGRDVSPQHVHVNEEVELAATAARQARPLIVGHTVVMAPRESWIVPHGRYSKRSARSLLHSDTC